MPTYTVIAKVDQIVTREVVLVVEADSAEQAKEKSTVALQTYPEPVHEPGVKRILTAKHFWIPRGVEITSVKKEKQDG